MKKTLAPGLVVLISLMMWIGVAQAKTVDAGHVLTDSQWQTLLRTADGEMIKLEKFKGQVIYLDFWASWCPPCRVSFPWMADVHRKFENKGLVIVANSVDEDANDGLRYAISQQAPFVVTLDSRAKLADQFNVPGMPTSYLIDRQGHVRMRHIGFKIEDAAKIEGAIEMLLGEQP